MAVVKHSVAAAAVTVGEVAAVVVVAGDPVRDTVNRGYSSIREEGSWR